MAAKKPQISITCSASVITRVDRAASKLNISRSRFFEEAAVAYLDDAEAQAKLVSNPRVMRAFAEAMSKPGVLGAMSKALSEDLDASQTQPLLDLFKKLSKGKEE